MTEAEKRHRRQSILDLIAASALSYPKQGWDVVAEKTGFTARAIEITGSHAGNFVDAIATVGLSRYEAVEAFRKAKHIVVAPVTRKGKKSDAAPVAPAAALPGNVVHPEPARSPVPPAARPDADRAPDKPAVAAAQPEPGRDPGGRREVRRDEKPEPEPVAKSVQNSLF